MFFPLWTVWVTVPLLALPPSNFVLVCLSAAHALVAASSANAANDVRSVCFILSCCDGLLLSIFAARTGRNGVRSMGRGLPQSLTSLRGKFPLSGMATEDTAL